MSERGLCVKFEKTLYILETEKSEIPDICDHLAAQIMILGFPPVCQIVVPGDRSFQALYYHFHELIPSDACGEAGSHFGFRIL